MKNLIIFLAVCAIAGCGAPFKSEREAYSRTAYHVADSVGELAQATPLDAPTRPGIEILKVETRAVAESLPVPEIRMTPIPFAAAVEAAKQAEAIAIEAGKTTDEAKALAVQAAAAVVADQPQAVENAIREYRAAASSADASTGIIGTIGNGIASVLGVLGPIGVAATGLLGMAFGLISAFKKRRVEEGLTKTIQGIDDAVDAVKTAYKEGGAKGLTDKEVKDSVYGALKNVHETMKDANAFMEDIKRIKAQYRAS